MGDYVELAENLTNSDVSSKFYSQRIMFRWLVKPLICFFISVLIVYIILLQRSEFANIFPSISQKVLSDPGFHQFSRLNPINKLSAVSSSSNLTTVKCSIGPKTKTDIRVNAERVTYLSENTQKNPDELNVFLVFHSHIDPGWLKTFNEYYDEQVNNVLTNMISFLSNHTDARFIWSEMSYLELWWRNASTTSRSQLKQLIWSRQLELCGGTWVMTDEATPYFWASIDNIVEGQRFIFDVLGTSATTSWSVDPFGHGQMPPYLLSLSGVKNLVIGRVNKHVKADLIEHGSLQFKWPQPWNVGDEADVPLISSLPRTYYTTADSCGEDGTVCCQFDFGPSSRSYCANRASITDKNIDEYATKLINQYKLLQPYYRSKNLLVAVGDDFFFRHIDDFTKNYQNYKRIIDYVNKTPKFKTKLRFSTVRDYFLAVREEKQHLPILRGDFFPYTENREGSQPYWTGYYVHRAAFKRLERIVQGSLRRLDLLRSLNGITERMDELKVHRRNLALVQHHDGITGTSKPHVMRDYAERLVAARHGIEQLELNVWHQSNETKFATETIIFDKLNNTHTITVFNPRTSSMPQRVSVLVSSPNIQVTAADGEEIKAELFPQLDLQTMKPKSGVYELIVYVRIPSLGTRQFILTVKDRSAETTVLAKSFFVSELKNMKQSHTLNAFRPISDGFVITTSSGCISFDQNGLPKSAKFTKDLKEQKLLLGYAHYRDSGGAYVFKPTTELTSATFTRNSSDPIVMMGQYSVRIASRLVFEMPNGYQLFHFVEIPLIQKPDTVDFRLSVISDPKHIKEYTVAANIQTEIQNEGVLYTDVNGMYLTERNVNPDNLHAANFFPSPTASVVEDTKSRLTIIFGQPTGSTASSNGGLEFFVDRNAVSDDGKGLSYGDSETFDTAYLPYRVVFERRHSKPTTPTLYHSQHVHDILEELLHPSSTTISSKPIPMDEIEWPCDVQLINIRHLYTANHTILLTFRALSYDCSILGSTPQYCAEKNVLFTTLKSLFPQRRAVFTSLNGIHDYGPLDEQQLVERLKPFQILTIKFE